MDAQQLKRYIRLIYTKAFRYLGAVLVLCALIGGIYGNRLHFVFASCAAGSGFLCWGWFTHLKRTGFKLVGFGEKTAEQAKTPYIWRIDKQKRLHKPSFMMTNADFDDDLVNATACNENEFSKENIIASRMYARAACGVMLNVISFIVNI